MKLWVYLMAILMVFGVMGFVTAGDFVIQDSSANVLFTADTSGGANATGFLYQNGYKIDEQFVNLSGDIMTGDLTFSSGNSLTINDGNITVVGDIYLNGTSLFDSIGGNTTWTYNQTDAAIENLTGDWEYLWYNHTTTANQTIVDAYGQFFYNQTVDSTFEDNVAFLNNTQIFRELNTFERNLTLNVTDARLRGTGANTTLHFEGDNDIVITLI